MSEKPRVKLSGTDGNVFAIIGKVVQTLRKAKQSEQAKEFSEKAMQCESYDKVLVLLHKYVDAY